MDITEEVFIGANASKASAEEGLGKYKSTWKTPAEPTAKVSGPVKLTMGFSVTVWRKQTFLTKYFT